MPRNLSYDLACSRFQSFTVSTALVGLYRTERRGQHPGFTAVLVIMAQLGPVTCHHNRDLLVSIGASPAIHGIIAFHSCKVVSKVVDDVARMLPQFSDVPASLSPFGLRHPYAA